MIKNIKKSLKNDFNKLETPPMERVIPSQITRKRDYQRKAPRRRMGIAIIAATLACLLVISCGAALPEILARLNSRKITDVTYQLIDVPDGWIGIYDLDDLLLINDETNKEGKFILMSDIHIPEEAYSDGGIFEGGIEPLGIYGENNYFLGELNGNGYTVSNIKLKALSAPNTVIAGLFGYGAVKIIHLGIEQVELRVELDVNTDCSEVYIGTLAAQAESVMGCYAKDVEVYFSDAAITEHNKGNALIGGLCGFSSYIDSCFVENASVTANISKEWDNVMVGGISGTSNACITSFFDGHVSSNKGLEDNVYIDGVSAMHYPAYAPRLLSSEAMEALRQKLKNVADDNGNYYDTKLISYYFKCEQSVMQDSTWNVLSPKIIAYTEDFYALEAEIKDTTWYVMDSNRATVDDFKELTDIIIKAFDGDERAAQQFFTEHNIKTGKLFCHSFEDVEKINPEALDGFDFERIWTQSTEGVIQKIFVEE